MVKSPLLEKYGAAELAEKLRDREWRLANLYWIVNKRGEKVLFGMNEVQKELHDELHNLNVIPKSRQLGITTFCAILFLDQVLFSKNKTAGIICHRIEDVKKIFKNKIKFAWDNLDPWVANTLGPPESHTSTEMRFKNGGLIFTSMTTRSQTLQFLLVSEFGYICAHAPEKAEEIVTGALNSIAPDQLVVIESTAQGREGYFYNFAMQGEKNEKTLHELTPLDWKLFFFPWYREPAYTLEGDVVITEQKQMYFRRLHEQYKITLTEGQKKWYVKKEETMLGKMFEEFPSVLEEAFMASIEGAYYPKEMERVFSEGRIMRVPFDPSLPVETWWDLGMDDSNVIFLTQSKGPQIRFVDLYFNRGEGLEHYVNWLNDRAREVGYRFQRHHLPHDVAVKELGTGISRQEVLFTLGMRNIQVGKKIGIKEGIDRVRTLFPRFVFDSEKTKPLTDALFSYRHDFDSKLGVWKDSPRHDDSSHFADAVRLMACEWKEMPLQTEGTMEVVQSASFF